MRVQANPEDIGRCGCGRREYCDGSHGLSAEAWQEKLARERAVNDERVESAPTAAEAQAT